MILIKRNKLRYKYDNDEDEEISTPINFLYKI